MKLQFEDESEAASTILRTSTDESYILDVNYNKDSVRSTVLLFLEEG